MTDHVRGRTARPSRTRERLIA